MKKRYLILPGLVLLAVCAAVPILFGNTYTVRLDQTHLQDPPPEDVSLIEVSTENGSPVAALTDKRVEDGCLYLTFRAAEKGKAFMQVTYGGKAEAYFHLYVHPFRVITLDSRFGDFTGDTVIPAAAILFLAAALWALIRQYRENVRRSLYQYRNVLALGLTAYLIFLLADLVQQLFSYHGLLDSAEKTLGTFRFFSSLALPVAFVLSILITISNVQLMRREGRNWRNMLGTILGVGLCLLTLLPHALGEYLQWYATKIDVHNEQSAALYIEVFTESFVSALVTYLECVLLGTVILGVKAARRMPAFDKDYILILGCQITDDGSLTPLLRSRADRAVEFARLQKEKTGRDIVFVPSGGKGADEVMAEADAIKNYLLSVGIPEERILPENASVNTEENIRNSMRLIREHAGEAEPKVAFSTTNYHVFRAGLLAQTQGEFLEGVGSPTKRYFWINAFVREFVATLAAERKTHLTVMLTLTVLIVLMVIIKYLSVI